MWNICVENENNNSKYLGSVYTRKRAEKFIIDLIEKKQTYKILKEATYQYE